jgi:hypothetical protein
MNIQAVYRALPALIILAPLGAAQTTTESAAPDQAAIVIQAGADWIALRPELEIEPGSALDLSAMGFVEAPAGRHGRVITRPDGQFAFANSPEKPRRFYGVNLCFGAHYLSKEEADRLAERLVRLGYNTLRIHHHERDLVQGQPRSTDLNPQKLDQLDYLVAALISRGIYLTTDLYVSRSVPYREIGIDRDGQIPMDTFKILVPVHAGAYENWQQFTRAFLGHINPYTNRRYADEPALAWLAMINEGNFGNFFRDIQTIPEWKKAWNSWLGQRYMSREALKGAWGQELKESEDLAAGTIELPERLQADGLRVRDCVAFLSETEREMVQKMRRFLQEELGCHALISNASSWTRFTTDQYARAIYDYVDDHFYVDHPQFLKTPWRLPSRCPNTSPLAEGAPGGRNITFTRLFDKPFALTEYNYSAPGRFRGVGGILTGAMGALQGWGGIWRFAYSHSREAMFTPSRMGYFDVVSDPLSQAAERASLFLFLRGDLQQAAKSVAVLMTEADLAAPAAKIPTLAPRWHWLAWVTRVGTQVVPSPALELPHAAILPVAWQTPHSDYPAEQLVPLDPYSAKDDHIVRALQSKGVFPEDLPPDPARKFFRSETGEITIDGPRDRLVLDTSRTAGGYAPAGQTIQTFKGGVRVAVIGADATVWASALDDQPILTSRRLLVTHLTDLQNTGIQYAEPARQTLLDWGRLPHLVRAGQAEISIRLEEAENYRVWGLSAGGRRLAEISARAEGGMLRFTADVNGGEENGARLLYEISLK